MPPFDSQFDPDGIHSHQDSLIHVHPFSASVTGSNARMGVFFEAMGMTVEPDAITLPGGETLEAGVECEGEPSEIVVAVWENGLDPSGDPDEIVRERLRRHRLRCSRQGVHDRPCPVGGTIPPPGPDVLDDARRGPGLERGEGMEPPSSAIPGPQDFGTGTGALGTATATTSPLKTTPIPPMARPRTAPPTTAEPYPGISIEPTGAASRWTSPPW